MNNFEDLIIVGKEKFAIFNKTKCKYLTKKVYDSILLSPSGNHILTKIKKSKHSDIDYICYIYNNKQILKYPNLIFKECFIGNTSIAFVKDLQKKCLVNNHGEIISKGFDYIEHLIGKLYYGYTLTETKNRINNINIININGEILPLTFNNIDSVLTLYANELQTLEDLVKNIDKYGVEITHISKFRPMSTSELLIIINKSIEYIKNNNTDITELLYLIGAYKHIVNNKNFKIDIPKENFDIDLSFSKINRIELNNIKKHIISELIEPIYKWHTR